MTKYIRLDESNQLNRRSVADALEVLRQQADFGDDDVARIDIALLRLPSREIVGLSIYDLTAKIKFTLFRYPHQRGIALG